MFKRSAIALSLTSLLATAAPLTPSVAATHGMASGMPMAFDGHTAREEAQGKAVLEKLQAKKTTCTELSEDNFGTLGEYLMGQMLGASHEAMNNMLTSMMGGKGEEQMHVVMGKRMSGCEPQASYPSQGSGYMPMMGMMNVSHPRFGGFGWVLMLTWWALALTGVVALVNWALRLRR